MLVILSVAPSIAQEGWPRNIVVERNTPRGPQKWALLVGVNSYADSRLPKLSYCGHDAETLQRLLIDRAGFPPNHVVMLHDKQPEVHQWPLRQVAEQAIDALIAQAEPEDLVLLAFSMHGLEKDGTSYLCPIDTDPDKPDTTVLPVPWLYHTLDTQCRASHKVVVIDACRRPSRSLTRASEGPIAMPSGLANTLRQAPASLLVLSSCSAEEASYEDSGLRHRVFIHYLRQGLTGPADQPRPVGQGDWNGRIDAHELFFYAAAKTKSSCPQNTA